MKLIRPMISADREIYYELTREFYLSGATLHEADEGVMHRNFDAIEAGDQSVSGLMFYFDGQVAGYSLLVRAFSTEVGGAVLWIEEIYVKPEFQGKGLASSLFKYIEQNCMDGIRRVRLEVARDNLRAYNLYERKGFAELRYLQMVREIL